MQHGQHVWNVVDKHTCASFILVHVARLWIFKIVPVVTFPTLTLSCLSNDNQCLRSSSHRKTKYLQDLSSTPKLSKVLHSPVHLHSFCSTSFSCQLLIIITFHISNTTILRSDLHHTIPRYFSIDVHFCSSKGHHKNALRLAQLGATGNARMVGSDSYLSSALQLHLLLQLKQNYYTCKYTKAQLDMFKINLLQWLRYEWQRQPSAMCTRKAVMHYTLYRRGSAMTSAHFRKALCKGNRWSWWAYAKLKEFFLAVRRKCFPGFFMSG